MKTKYLDGVKDPHKVKIFKVFHAETKAQDQDGKRILIAKISDPASDRSNDHVFQNGAVTDNFQANPVVTWAHQYDELPIAKCTGLNVQDSGILATVEFPEEGKYEKADIVYDFYKNGFLNAWSIGFMPLEYDENDEGGYDFKSWEMFEFAAVPVPDQPRALTVMRSKGLNVDQAFESMRSKGITIKEVEAKGAIGYKKTPLAAKDEKWDAGEEVKAATVDDLKVMCAWVDSENADNKGAYKLPHHEAAGEHAVVWNGVKAAGAAIDGARGGVDIPEGDVAGVKAHLAKHYAEFDETPPWENKDDEKRSIEEAKVETKKKSKGTKASKKQLEDEIAELKKRLEAKEQETKELEKKALPEGDDDNPENPGYSEDTKVTDLTAGELADLIDRCLDAEEEENEDDEGDDSEKDDDKSVHGAVKKDVNEVIALGYILDCLSYFIEYFEDNGINEEDINSLKAALTLVLGVVKNQAELGKKSFTVKNGKLIAKVGRTISAENEEKLKAAHDHMGKAVEHVKDVLGSVAEDPDENDPEDPEDNEPGDTDDEKSTHATVRKAGRALSAENEEKLKSANDHMDQAMGHVKDVLGTVGEDEKEEVTPGQQNPSDEPHEDEPSDDEKAVSVATLKTLQKALKQQDQSIGLTLRSLKNALSQNGGESKK